MHKIRLSAADMQLLASTAEALLWCGKDRAADFIYAALEAEGPPAGDHTSGSWLEVFAA